MNESNMYTIHPAVSEDAVNSLLELAGELPFKFSNGSRMRKGRNAPHVLSKYWYTRWFDWKHKQRVIYREAFPAEFTEITNQCWFVKYEANTGLLDVMDNWVNQKNPATFYCMALYDRQTIHINDELVIVNKGEILEFTINQIHEVRPLDRDRLWACIMARKATKK